MLQGDQFLITSDPIKKRAFHCLSSRRSNVGLALGHLRRRWLNAKTKLAERHLFVEEMSTEGYTFYAYTEYPAIEAGVRMR